MACDPDSKGAHRPASPPAEGWLTIFNGRDLTGWKQDGGKAYVEDGALVSENGAVLFYEADWAEFVLSCEMAGGGGKGMPILSLCFLQPHKQPASSVVRILAHGDGDAHVWRGRQLLWRSGAGRFRLDSWTPARFELASGRLRIYVGDALLGGVKVPEMPAVRGGISFYSYDAHAARIRNIRVRVISR